MLWTEPAQPKVPNGGGTRNGSHFSTTWLGGEVYSEIRRFVVVSKGYGSSICWCVWSKNLCIRHAPCWFDDCSPIHTYSGLATFKNKLPAPQRHTIIYTTLESPGETCAKDDNGKWVYEDLILRPIRVINERMEDNDGNLDPLSRLNYSKVYTVEHYVRVLNIGMVASKSLGSLLVDSNWSSKPIGVHPPRPSRKSSGQSSSHHKKDHSSRKPHKSSHYWMRYRGTSVLVG